METPDNAKLKGQDKLDFAAKALGVDQKGNKYAGKDWDWQTDLKKANVQGDQYKNLNSTMGSMAVNAIANSIRVPSVPNYKVSASDILSVTNAFGGPEAFKPGTPGAEAVQYLVSHGHDANVTNIELYLSKKHPDFLTQQGAK